MQKTAKMKVRRIIWALPFIMVSCSNYELNEIKESLNPLYDSIIKTLNPRQYVLMMAFAR